MEQEVKAPEPVVFMSGSQNLVVGLSRLHHREEDGRKVYFPKLRFEENRLELLPGSFVHWKGDDFPTNDLIALLRRDRRNQKNDGNEFWEQSAIEKTMVETGGFYAQMPDDGFNNKDIEYLSFLNNITQKMTPPQKDMVFEKVDYLFDRFRVINSKKPNKFYNMRKMKAWIVLFLEDLKTVGIDYENADKEKEKTE